MMKANIPEELLNKYLEGNCTDEEMLIVEGWFNQELRASEYSVSTDQLENKSKEIWSAIQSWQESKHASKVPQKIKLWQILSTVAAAVIFIFAINLIYFKPKEQHIEISSIIAPLNKENNLIQLPDGSMVILGKGSKLTFSKSFKGMHKREVYLTGKAFFDIKHNASKPFIVYSGKIKTTVLGTAFDIRADSGSKEIVVRVIRGRVNVSTEKSSLGDLVPNKQIVYNTIEEKSSYSDVNALKEMRWTSQDLLLNDVTFEAICTQLEKRYGVKIKIDNNELKTKRSTISLTSNEDLNSFLQTICDFNEAKFVREGDEITITAIN